MDNIIKFFYEVGQAKKVDRSGWWIAGISDPESVAEHSFRVAIIGYVLAKLENGDPDKVITMCLFHDIHETRINDIHKIGQKYINTDDAEKQAFLDQVKGLPKSVSSTLNALISEFNDCESLEAKIAHDADKLECLLQAREYHSQGYNDVVDWIDSCGNNLNTKSAQEIAEKCMQIQPHEWWCGLKKL